MLLSNLIEDLQELAEEHGKEIEVAVVIEPDPMSTMNIIDAIAYEMEKPVVTDWEHHKNGRILSLYFS